VPCNCTNTLLPAAPTFGCDSCFICCCFHQCCCSSNSRLHCTHHWGANTAVSSELLCRRFALEACLVDTHTPVRQSKARAEPSSYPATNRLSAAAKVTHDTLQSGSAASGYTQRHSHWVVGAVGCGAWCRATLLLPRLQKRNTRRLCHCC
jgi:hypothetical protein